MFPIEFQNSIISKQVLVRIKVFRGDFSKSDREKILVPALLDSIPVEDPASVASF